MPPNIFAETPTTRPLRRRIMGGMIQQQKTPVMQWLLLFCLGLLPAVCFGQLLQVTDNVVCPGGNSLALMLASPENNGAEAARLADRDIAAGHSFLLLQSGIAPAVYPGDSIFCERFNVAYWEEGCAGPGLVFMRAYNARVFEYLQQKYGNTWRKSVRRDVVGLKQWKAKR